MKLDLPKIEEKILSFWKKKNIFRKSLEKTKQNPRFVFYEGPPTANGKPGIHHLLARAFKDIICRYKTMQGFFVERKAGWDTHGLPVEIEVEKEINLKSKKSIEEHGIDKFNQKCKKSAWLYKKDWEKFTERIGFWLDMENPYITYQNNYIETVWWILKQIWEEGFLYEDYKVVPFCPRCGTSLSSHEVSQGYEKIKENSIYVKFKKKGEENTFFLCWTTTPWTLPGNVVLSVNPKFKYLKVKVNNEYLILAEKRLEVLDQDYEVIEEFKGEYLEDSEYEPLFPEANTEKAENIYKVILADFVSLEEGTGIVHTAPAFGDDDMVALKNKNRKLKKEDKEEFPVLIPVDEEGKFKKEIKEWQGKFVKKADPEIIKHLKERELIYKEEIIEHDYPFCWRCKTPLLYYIRDTWFIKTTEVKKRLIKNNQKINWVPEHVKTGRFGEWLNEVKDWNLSRERYWGTPLPIWKCKECEKEICIGSREELVKEAENLSSVSEIEDLHRPFIDEIVLKCECGSEMKRTSEVIDCWFDSGAMPFAQQHYPFENKEKIDKKEVFPADYITEAIDQTRGWFYTLLAISTLLGKGNPYKNVICLGLVLDSEGQKMSKSKGNIVKPKEVMEKFGADCARLYFYTINAPAEPKRFDFDDVQDLYRKFFDTLWQSFNFFSIYTEEDFKPKKNLKPNHILDKWILSKVERLNSEIVNNLNKYDVVKAARLLRDFVDDLSNWYIRTSRRRFQKPEKKEEKKEASQTLYYVLRKFVKLSAPFTPFISEEIYKKLKEKKESVHLENYPKAENSLIDDKIEGDMQKARQIVKEALALRAEKGIKVRQPLSFLAIDKKIPDDFMNLTAEQINVKEIRRGDKIELETRLTEGLRIEGILREIIRQIQQMRKKAGFKPKDGILIRFSGENTLDRILIDNKEEILNETKAEELKKGNKPKTVFDIEKEIKVDNKKLWLAIKKT